MAYRAMVLRTEPPSIIELTPGQQPVDHAGQVACRQHERAFVRMMRGVAIFAKVKSFEFRVAHTNPVGCLHQVISQIGTARSRQRSILGKGTCPIDGYATPGRNISRGAVLLARSGLRQMNPMAGHDAQGRVAGIRRRFRELVISRHAPSSCARASVPSREGGHPRVSFVSLPHVKLNEVLIGLRPCKAWEGSLT